MAEQIPYLGKIIDDPEINFRDAIHIPVVPMTIGPGYRYPTAGDRVQLLPGTRNVVIYYDEYHHKPDVKIGIIDPFIEAKYDGLKSGDRVWVWLTPGTVTGVRHHYEHPVLDAPPSTIGEAEKALREWCAIHSFDYDEVVEVGIAVATGNKSEWGEYLTRRGRELHSYGEIAAEVKDGNFWENLEKVIDAPLSQEQRDSIGWSCSC
jgi:hypothetical protein